MKKVLMAAIAALSLSALAGPAFAREEGWGRDRGGGSQWNNDGGQNRGDERRGDGGQRGGDNGGQRQWQRGGGDQGQQQQQRRFQGGGQGSGLAGGPNGGERRQWNGPRNDGPAPNNPPQRNWSRADRPDNGGQAWRRDDRPRNDDPRNDGPRNDGPRREWSNNNNGGGQSWRRDDGPRNDGPRNDGPRNDGRDWRREGGPDRNWSNNDRRDDRNRDWNNGPRRDDNRYGDNRRWDNDRRSDRRRDFSDNRRYAYGGRDYRGPRYDDWHSVHPGRYFNDYYARGARSYFGHAFYWWDYPGWRRPYRPYRVGYILPDSIYWDDLPYDYYGYLPPPPYGCRYVAVDRDVLLVVIASGLILDALIYDGDWRGYY